MIETALNILSEKIGRLWLDFCQLHIAQKNTLSHEPTLPVQTTRRIHHQQRQPDLAPLRRRADAVPPLPVPRSRWHLDQAGGPPQEDLGGGASNTERGGNSGVANAWRDRGECREGEIKTWRNGSVRFRLILIYGTYKG